MTAEANQLLEIALKKVDLRGGFSPVELGAKVGLSRVQAEAAARALANAGVLVLGFDQSAEFSADFRKSRAGLAGAAAATTRRATRPAAAAAKRRGGRDTRNAARQTAKA